MSNGLGLKSAVCAAALLSGVVCGYANDYRGLWVGQANLNYMTEVTVGLDAQNNPAAPDPDKPTQTADQAQIRLILHVDKAGQVHLLKDVAILQRDMEDVNNGYYASELDLALVTDEDLFVDFPSQEATRISSVVFDFGDIKATRAVDAAIDAAVVSAVNLFTQGNDPALVITGTTDAMNQVLNTANVSESFYEFLTVSLTDAVVGDVATNGVSSALRTTATDLVNASFYNDSRALDLLEALDAVAANGSLSDADKVSQAQQTVARYADVENKYGRFIHGESFGVMVQEAAVAAANGASITSLSLAADLHAAIQITEGYQTNSFNAINAQVSSHVDTGATDAMNLVLTNMVDLVLAQQTAVTNYLDTVTNAVAGFKSTVLATNNAVAVAVLTDVGQNQVAALSSLLNAVDLEIAQGFVGLNGTVANQPAGMAFDLLIDTDADQDALNASVQIAYTNALAGADKTVAVNEFQAAISTALDTTFSSLHGAVTNGVSEGWAQYKTGSNGLISDLERTGTVTLETLQQVAISPPVPGSTYTEFVKTADFLQAAPAVATVISETLVYEFSKDASVSAQKLSDASLLAARATLRTLFAKAAVVKQTELPLIGTFEMGTGDTTLWAVAGETVGSAGLSGVIELPANHPTNPFLHSRHPDHTVGFDIERHVRFDFDGISTNAFVKTGLGIDRVTGIYREEVFGLHKPLGANADRGLRVEGTFELNRISLIDTLNAR